MGKGGQGGRAPFTGGPLTSSRWPGGRGARREDAGECREVGFGYSLGWTFPTPEIVTITEAGPGLINENKRQVKGLWERSSMGARRGPVAAHTGPFPEGAGEGPAGAARHKRNREAGWGDGNVFLLLKGDIKKECSGLPTLVYEDEMPGLVVTHA